MEKHLIMLLEPSPASDNYSEETDNSKGCEQFQKAIQEDLLEFSDYIISSGLHEELLELKKPSLWLSLVYTAIDLGIIFLACSLCQIVGVLFWPVGILVCGNRQRALGNLLHEASHKNFGGKQHFSESLVNLLIGLPLFSPLPSYRRLHNLHHRNLGCPGGDVDLIQSSPETRSHWFKVYLEQVLSFKMWCDSFMGYFVGEPLFSQFAILIWWISFSTVLCYFASVEYLVLFLGMWFLSKATSYHLITVFRELSDHFGLEQGGIIRFTRNNPTKGLLAIIFHPHNDSYHLIHHLDPGIPFVSLPSVHKLLLNWDKYTNAEQCDGYFWGSRKLTSGWGNRYLEADFICKTDERSDCNP